MRLSLQLHPGHGKTNAASAVAVRLYTRPVRYTWCTPDGTICHSSSVVVSSTKGGLRQALKRFWQTNSHINPEEA